MIKKTLFGTVLATAVMTTALTTAPLRAQQVQSYQVIELQETVRNLNGRVEELQFQLLQLQEKLRRMEEDNEARFQELEERRSSVEPDETAPQTAGRADKPVTGRTRITDGEDTRLGKSEPSGDAPSPDVKQGSATTPRATPPSLEPRRLGTLTFDKDGNVVTGDTGSVAQDGGDNPFNVPFSTGTEGAAEASEFGATPVEVFQAAKQAYDARNYSRAASAFGAHVKAWPRDTQSGQARYYLGQSLFWQRQYYQAAETHLETHNDYPTSPVAAENLLGLGLSLAGLNQREVACATYAEVLKQYPDAEARLGQQVRDEQAAARC
ncbi:MAG: tol-pal system protein YbgF [Pseudomonadota bacterium]